MPKRERNHTLPLFASELSGISGSLTFEVVAAKKPRELRARVIGTGFGANSENGMQWFVPDSEEGIGSARKIMGGARLHWHRAPDGNLDHSERFGFSKKLSDWLGTDHDAGYLKDIEVTADGLFGTVVLDPDVPEEIAAALTAKKVGLSVECSAERRPRILDGKPIVDLINFAHPADRQATVAIVTHPALRGEVLSIAASLARRSTAPAPLAAAQHRSTPMTLEQARAILLASDSTPEQRTQADSIVAAHEAKEAARIATEARVEAQAQLLAAKQVGARSRLEDALRASKLPEANAGVILDVLAPTIAKGEDPKADVLAAEIKRQRDILAATNAGGADGGGSRVQVGAGVADKMKLCVERLLFGMNPPEYAVKRYADLNGHGTKLLASREQEAGIGLSDRAYSVQRSFREFMGFEIADLWRRGPRHRDLVASINLAQWGDAFENVLNIMGLAYQENPDFSAWRLITTQVPITGTFKQERTVVFGYANLPSVVEGANYTAAVSPGDNGHGYTVLKYGYTEDWTREAILNDRINALGDVVRKMALAADRTKYEFVFDKVTIAGQPTMDYDSVALLHSSSHGANLNTSALTATSLAATRLVMSKQTDGSNSKRLGIEPKFLLIPVDLRETAWNLLKPAAEEPGGLTAERAFLRTLNLTPIVVRHWTNTGDHFLVADPRTSPVPVFEMGFEGGRETADIFVQDAPSVGSVFERDAITVAIKQDYFGGSPMRHEAFAGNDV